jgi:tRNA uridine 5-carboxymethylaminomethyl modification enzyme
VHLEDLIDSIPDLKLETDQIGVGYKEILESVEIKTKYEGYILKEKEMADKIKRLDKVYIPESIDFKTMTALSSEAIEKLSKQRPETLGQASRISGISPADVSVLLVHLGR